ncbi:MAG: cytidine deaminase [Pyrinomonadaceae bacterium]
MKNDSEKLIEIAKQARAKASAPFSNFKVGAVLVGKKDEIFTGCNIENASYGLTMCAERVAIFKAISEGATRFSENRCCCRYRRFNAAVRRVSADYLGILRRYRNYISQSARQDGDISNERAFSASLRRKFFGENKMN